MDYVIATENDIDILTVSRIEVLRAANLLDKIPSSRPADITKMSKAKLNAELEKGYSDMLEGKTKPVKKAFADIRKEYYAR